MKIWRVPYPKFGAGSGLERVAAIGAELGLDLAGFGADGAAIVGSNGKGSTAALTAAILRQTGAKVGLFTSPHLFALNERFNSDGEDVDDDALEHHWARVAAAAECAGARTQLGGFEFLFLIAADWFAARNCAYTIWEAGIGGRLDPVRLIAARRLALTALDLEHTALLGETLAEIARDKIDAAPDGATLYVGASCAPLREVIEAHCATRGVNAVFAGGKEEARLLAHVALAGAHQRDNAMVAMSLARDLAGDALRDELVARGLGTTHWPGRLEVLGADPLVVIDVGHTPDAVRAALAGFNAMRGARPGLLICGVSADKAAGEIAAALAPAFEIVICASARHKGAPAAEIAAHANAANPGAEIILADCVAEARKVALIKGRARGGAIYVAGGLFLAAEFRAIHLGRDPAALAFF